MLELFNNIASYIALHPLYSFILILIYSAIIFIVVKKYPSLDEDEVYLYQVFLSAIGACLSLIGVIVLLVIIIACVVIIRGGVDYQEYSIKSFELKQKEVSNFRNLYKVKVNGNGNKEFNIRANKISVGDKIGCKTVFKGYDCGLTDMYKDIDNERVGKLEDMKNKEEQRKQQLEEIKLKLEAEKELKKEELKWNKKLKDLESSKGKDNVYRNKILSLKEDEDNNDGRKVYKAFIKNGYSFNVYEVDSNNPIKVGDEVSCKLLDNKQFVCWITKYMGKDYVGDDL